MELRLPTLKEMENVYCLPEKTHATYEWRKMLLYWYQEEWLVKFAGYDYFGPNQRNYKTSVESTVHNGHKAVCVTKESEAMGLLTFANTRTF